jgi:hypothetical protein
MDDYIAEHIGDGKFKVIFENGEIKEAGDNMCGMIRYTYFEDYTLPEIGWSVNREKLIKDYFKKISKNIHNIRKENQ